MAALRFHIIFVNNKQNDASGLLYHKIKNIHKLDIALKPQLAINIFFMELNGDM